MIKIFSNFRIFSNFKLKLQYKKKDESHCPQKWVFNLTTTSALIHTDEIKRKLFFLTKIISEIICQKQVMLTE